MKHSLVKGFKFSCLNTKGERCLFKKRKKLLQSVLLVLIESKINKKQFEFVYLG